MRIPVPILLNLLTPFLLPAPVQAQGAQADWTFSSLGTGIGHSGLVPSATAQRRELIVGCGGSSFGPNLYWVVLAHDGSGNGFEEVWVSPKYHASAALVDIEAGELGGKPGPELLVLLSDGTLEIWNQSARTRETSFPTGLTAPTAITLADVDADQALDVVVVDATSIRALSSSGRLLWQVANAGGYDVVVAQLDTDPALEVATTDGSVIDCATRLAEWQWPAGFGGSMAVANIDQDPQAELLVGEISGWVRAFDVDQRATKWSFQAHIGLSAAIAAGDVDRDGVIELLVGNGQWGEITAYDTITKAKEWGIRNPDSGTTRVAWSDLDGDGTAEVIWGAGYASTGRDGLYIADCATRQIEWSSVDLSGPFFGPFLGDVTGDNVPELVSAAAQSDSGYSGARLLLFDLAPRKLRYVSQAVSGSFSPLTSLELVPFQSSSRLDALVVADRVQILTWDATAQAFRTAWLLPSVPGFRPRIATLHDVQGDPRREVVVGSDDDVRVFDPTSQQELWRSLPLGSRVQRLAFGDTDFDQAAELHVLLESGVLHVFDIAPLQAKTTLNYQLSRYTSLALTPIGPGDLLLVGEELGAMTGYIPVGAGYFPVGPVPVGTARLDSLQWFFPTQYWCFAQGGSIRLQDGLTPLWQSAPREPGFGTRWVFDPTTNSILAADTRGLAGYRLF